MLEVEMKFKVTSPERIQEQLNMMGFLPSEKHFESDRYYNAPDRDFAQTDEALRIRQVGDESQLTYKGPKQGAPTKSRTRSRSMAGTSQVIQRTAWASQVSTESWSYPTIQHCGLEVKQMSIDGAVFLMRILPYLTTLLG